MTGYDHCLQEEPSFSGVDSAAGAPMYMQQQAGAYAAGQQMQQPEHMQRPASSHGPGAGVSGAASFAFVKHSHQALTLKLGLLAATLLQGWLNR